MKVLNRNLGPVTHLANGEYTIETASGRPAIRCPECGDVSELEDTHRVLAGGVVSLVRPCPAEHCSFIEFLHLEAWGLEVAR